MKPFAAAIVAGMLLALITAQSIGLIFGGSGPTLASPGSMVAFVPFALGVPLWLAPLCFAVLFWAWSPGLFRGEAIIPVRTFALLVLSGLFSLLWFGVAWRDGVKYQGFTFTVWAFLLTVLLLSLCSFLVWRSRAAQSFSKSLATHTLLFSWLVSYAFPYLGEPT
jgi:hypothetical protein